MTQAADLDSYTSATSLAKRVDFGGFGVMIDRSPTGNVDYHSSRHAILVDLCGTDGRTITAAKQSMEGPSEAGSVAFFPAEHEARIAWNCARPEKACIVIDTDPKALVALAPELFVHRHRLSLNAAIDFRVNSDMAHLARMLARQVVAADPGDNLFRQSLFHTFALALAGHVNGRFDLSGQRLDRRLHRAQEFIEAHFTQDISLDEICRASGCSATQLTDLFRRCLNQTPYSYVIDRRLAEAMRLLRRNDEPLALLALSCGFADQQHMTRLFRARLGSTPSVYRRETASR